MKRTPLNRTPRSRAILTWLGGSFIIGLVILLFLVAADIRFGQGYFTYRYSPLRAQRVTRTLPVFGVAMVACAAARMLLRADRKRRRVGIALLAVAMFGAGAWIWWAPPSPATQQMFNLTSFSTDGAFLFEAGQVKSVPLYLRRFPEQLKRTPEQLGGTRILSNPPGTTVFFHSVLEATRHPSDSPGWMERVLIDRENINPLNAPLLANALTISIVLCFAWMLAGVMAYPLGRLFLSPAGAAVFAVIVTFNPCTVHFIPGKDPGQLLTINAMLWAWFAGWQRKSSILSAIAGAILVFGSVFGLVHIWVALAATAATLWQARSALRQVVVLNVIPAVIGGILVVVAAVLALDWNIPITLFAVARRWGEIQKTFDMSRPIWFLIGLPIFLLFLSPGFWLLFGLSQRRRRLNLGTRLAICTAAVMLFIYFVMGVTYELPRLWVAFLPPLLLGLAIDRPLLRSESEHPRIARVFMLVICIQIVFTALHWTVFDAREAEYRLMTGRFYE